MLLKNLDLKADLTNGSRLIIKNIFQHLLNVEILSGYHRGQRHYLPKMLFQPSDSWLPFVLKRLQFPIRLAFSMTINKCQGQTFDKLKYFFADLVFPMDSCMWHFHEHVRSLTVSETMGIT